ncbi:MAG: phytoene desaturase family protein [Aestuariivirga sp.]|uniref:phytoene desaturase family protein n=1 Tax=Aestuariivirga sp. TaxID=2650926 RepID=UPI0038D1E83F
MTDYVIAGSGINGLVAASLLALKGRKVLVLERNPEIGGCIRTEEATLPGFTHDVMATTFVLFLLSPAYGVLGPELEKRGLAFAHPEIPTGVLRPDGAHLLLRRDRGANIAAFDALAPGDGQQYSADMQKLGADAPFLFALLGGKLWSWRMAKTIAAEAWRRGPSGLSSFFGAALQPARHWLQPSYSSDLFHALLAPWVLHTGLGPESAYSGQMARVIAFALEAAGAPVVKGGASNIVSAFARLITDHGGEIRTNADVAAVSVDATGRAAGVRLASGADIAARQGVICSMTPAQLYGRLLKDWRGADSLRDEARRFAHGKGNMQIHYALAAPPQWRHGDLGKVALLHLTPGLDGVSKAVNEAERGMLPAEPTICVGQPTAFDPSRAPPGKAILWLQLPEAPRHIKGDAAGKIAAPPDGQWTEEVREAYADRIEETLCRHIADFRSLILARRCYSPADLAAMNINLVGGDPYGGACSIDQFFLWRPLRGTVNHETPVKGLYHIGASTHPGPGLGGGSGFLLANSLA